MATSIIVDGYGSGGLLAPEFRSKGIGAVHIETGTALKALCRSHQPSDYSAEFQLLQYESIELLAKQLRSLDPIAVVPGVDSGVAVADSLAHHLGLPGNDPSTSPLRRDKFEMISHLAQSDCRMRKCWRVRNLDDLRRVELETDGGPLVLKPTMLAGGRGLTICHTASALRAAWDKVLECSEGPVAAAIVEDWIEGSEYEVNTVSWNGRHGVTDLWQYVKRKNQQGVIYDWGRLIPSRGRVQDTILEYTNKVLDELGVRFGAAHTEVCMEQGGPTLIEVGARLCGGRAPEVVAQCTGYGQHQALVDAYSEETAYDLPGRHYKHRSLCLNVHLICPEDGLRISSAGEKALRDMDHCLRVDLLEEPRERLRRTTDLLSSPGTVRFIAETWEVLAPCIEHVRELESEILYKP